MIKEIKYLGHTAASSDYECADGELALSLNLINEDGALRPLLPPSVRLSPNGLTPQYVHRLANGAANIIYANASQKSFYAVDANGVPQDPFLTIDTADKLYSVSSIGNTLLALTSGGMYYCLYDSGMYKALGKHLPELCLSFGLSGHEVGTMLEGGLKFPDALKAGGLLTDANSAYATEPVMAGVNKFIADNATNAGRFALPFFVRYAYRLYDGSLTMHSPAMLMRPVIGSNPVVSIWQKSGNDYDCFVEGIVADLTASCENQNDLRLVSERWGDIIKSVDIFISAPIYTHNQAGQITSEMPSGALGAAYSTVSLDPHSAKAEQYAGLSQLIPLRDILPHGASAKHLDLPAFGQDDAVETRLLACSSFYFLKSLALDEAANLLNRRIDVPADYLQSLIQRERMSDDFDSHDIIIPRRAFNYNSRLNLADIRKRSASLIATPPCQKVQGGNYLHVSYGGGITPYIFVKKNYKSCIVKGPAFSDYADQQYPCLHCLDPDAYKVLLVRTIDNKRQMLRFDLEPHDFINGSVCLQRPFDSLTQWCDPAEGEIPDDSDTVPYVEYDRPNKLYLSEVNNPFLFPVANIVTIGSGRILGISAAAKALSQGQFGAFPLYAFTDEGVWALEVSATGGYSARQPITRDVCVDADGIAQLDSAVLFPTDRGIMLLSGSTAQCISDIINSATPSVPVGLETFGTYLPSTPFADFIKRSRMLYDYLHQRVYVYNPGIAYAYVYSLKSGMWGMARSRISAHLNSYPDALAVDADGNILDFSQPDASAAADGLLLTRPLKLDLPDTLKTVDTVIQRGDFARGHVQSLLYGSRDLRRWHPVWSSKDHFMRGFRGTPYKYFRIALLCALADGESLRGASVQFTPRHLDRLR